MKKMLFLLLIHATSMSYAQLNLEQYKDQVAQKDPSVKAAQISAEAGRSLLSEGDTVTGIQLFSQYSYLNDRRPTANPGFQGDRTQNTSFLLGLKQQTLWGVQWSLSQNFSHTRIYNASSTAVPVPDYYDMYPKLDLVIPLWRNFAGSETSSFVDQTEQQSIARSKQADLAKIQKDIEIETAYYAVATQQQNLEIIKDSLSRAERVLDWTKSRINRNLTDGSDIYQSQAAVAARKIELATAQRSLSEAVTKFNQLRGVDGSELNEKLITKDVDLSQLNLNKLAKKARKDILLKQQQNIANEAAYKAQFEKHKPQLDLSISTLAQGRDTTYESANSKQFTENKDYALVALTFSMPLNQIAESSYRDGYNKLVLAQQFTEKARLNDERLAWESTVDLAAQLKVQLSTMKDLEVLQKNKADAERDRFNRGRSTLFQVLAYEQDYLSSRSQRNSLEFQVRQFISQLNLFE